MNKYDDRRDENEVRKRWIQIMTEAVRRCRDVTSGGPLVRAIPFGVQEKLATEEATYAALLPLEDAAGLTDEKGHALLNKEDVSTIVTVGGETYMLVAIVSRCPVFKHICDMGEEDCEDFDREVAADRQAVETGLDFTWTGSVIDEQLDDCVRLLGYLTGRNQMWLDDLKFDWVRQQLAGFTTWRSSDGMIVPTPLVVVHAVYAKLGGSAVTRH